MMETRRQKRPLLPKPGASTEWYPDPLGFAPPPLAPPTYRDPRRLFLKELPEVSYAAYALDSR